MKKRSLLLSALALSLLAIGVHTGTAQASSTSYAHPYNALNSYITLGHFHMVNNGNYSVGHNYSNHYNQNTNSYRHLKTIGGNWSNTYRPYAQLNDAVQGSSNPQSAVIKPNGTTFIASNNGNNDSGTKVRIVRYNIKHVSGKGGNANLVRPHKGPIFRGGHGQALAWNPKTNQLWLEYNVGHEGSRNNVKLLLINQKTLKPEHQLKFKFEPYSFGAVLAFDKYGNAYNAIDTFNSSRGGAPIGSLKIYKGKITKHNAHFHMVQGLRHYPGATMQNMSYNPSNNRLYFLADGDYMSVPVKKLGHGLRAGQVHATKLNEHYEPEDLAFYRGHGYLLLHYPSQLLISNGNGHWRKSHHARKHNRKHSYKRHASRHSHKRAHHRK